MEYEISLAFALNSLHGPKEIKKEKKDATHKSTIEHTKQNGEVDRSHNTFIMLCKNMCHVPWLINIKHIIYSLARYLPLDDKKSAAWSPAVC
jgi:hypothetical protein